MQQPSALHLALARLVRDGGLPEEDRALLRSILKVLPEWHEIQARGYGELIVKYQAGEPVLVQDMKQRKL